MDRQSPTSIRYSYSNSSNTDSVGISRSLERSGNFNSGGALSNRIGTFNYGSRQNLSDLPIIQHPSESAHSSSIPSQYMGESSIPQIQRPSSNQHRAEHSLNFNTNSINNNAVTSSVNNANMSSLDRATYQMQIRQLKILIHQQQQQLATKTQLENSLQQMQSKYTRCIQQLSQTVEQNQQLRKQLQRINSQMSEVGSSRNFMDTSKSNQMSRAKQQQIRRLKDSVLVLQKQKRSYQEETNELEKKLSDIEYQNKLYEDKLVLISHQIQRLKWMLNQKGEEKTKLTNQNQTLRNQNQSLRNQIIQLKVDLQRHGSRIGAESVENSQRNAQYAKKLQQLYYEVQKKGREKVELQTQNRKLMSQNRDKQQEYRVQLQKMRIEININKRQMDELQARNIRLSDELRVLNEKNNTSQMQLSNVSTQTAKLQLIIKQLEQKLKLMEKQYNSQLQKINNFTQQNGQLKNNIKLAQQQIKRTRSQAQRFEQQSIQLRRKIQQISINSQKQTTNLGQNVKQKDFALRELEKRVKQMQSKNKDHELRNKQLIEQLRESQSSNKSLQIRNRQLAQQSKNLQGRCRQYEHKLKQSQSRQQRIRKQSQSKLQQQHLITRQLQDRVQGLQLKYQSTSKQLKQYETKNISLSSQYQKLQITYNNLVSSKNLQQSRLRQTFTSNLGQLQSQLNNVNMYKNQLNTKFEQIRQQNSKLTQQLVNNRNIKMQLQTKITMLQTMIEHNKQDYAYLQQSFNSVQNQLRQQINLTKQLTLKLNKENQTQKSQYFQEITKKQTILFDLQQKVNDSTIMVTGLHSKLQDKDSKINQQMKQIDQYRQQSIHAEQQLDSIRADFKNLVQELEYLKQSNISKEKAFMQAKQQINTNLQEKQAKLNQKTDQVWKYQSEIVIINQKNRVLDRECQIHKENGAKLQSELAALMERLRVTQRQSRQLKQNQLRTEEKQRMQEREIIEYKSGIQRLEEKYRQVERECNEAVESATRMEQHNRTLERQYTSNTSSMSQRYKILQRECSQVKANAGRLEERCRHWEMQFRQLEGRYNELNMDKSQVDDKYKETDTRYRQMEMQNKQLEHQYRHTQQQLRQMQTQLNLCRLEMQRASQQNNQLQQQAARSQQSSSSLQSKYRQSQQQSNKYKQSLTLMSTKYRTLQLQHNQNKQSLHNLQHRYAQIQKRSSALQQQLNILQKQYVQMIQVHKVSQQQLLHLRQIMKKTQQQRYFIQQQKQQQGQYLISQLKNRDQTIKQLQSQVQSKSIQIQQLHTQQINNNTKIQTLHTQLLQTTHRYQQKISTLSIQLQHVLKTKQKQIAEYQSNLINTKEQYTQYKLQVQEQVHGLQDQVRQSQQEVKQSQQQITQQIRMLQQQIQIKNREIEDKEYRNKEVEHTCNIYADKIQKLTYEISQLTNKMNNSRFVQEREVENVVQAKNTRIQELERDIINREEYYRQEVLKMQNTNAANMQQQLSLLKSQHALKVSQLQHMNNTLQSQLMSEEEKYKQLTLRLESILSTNDQHFQQILQYLEKILQINTQLIISVSKTNSTIVNVGNSQINAMEDIGRRGMADVGAFRVEAMGVLGDIRDKLVWEAETTRTRLDDEDNRRLNKERTERKEKQDNLEREERIIKYLQEEKEKSRSDKERQERKFIQLQQKLQQNQRNYLESIEHMSKQITRTIQQELATTMNSNSMALREQDNSRQRQERELKEERELRERQSQENIIRESRNNNKHLHEITTNILSKMDNLTHLFLENNEEYKNSMAGMQDHITRLEHANMNQQKQLEEYRHRERDMVYKHSEEIERLVHKSQSAYKEHQYANSASVNELKQQYKDEISRLGLQVERGRIESEEMRKQYDRIVSQYEKTNQTLQQELETARRELQRQSMRYKEKQDQVYRLMTSTNSTGRNNSKNSIGSNSNQNRSSLQSIQSQQQQLIQNINNRHNQQLSQTVQKYQNKIILLSQQIQRLHRVIDSNKQHIIKIQKQYRSNNTSISKQYDNYNSISISNRKYDNQILWLKQSIAEKDIQIKLLNTKLSAIQSNNNISSSRYQDAYQLEIMELKHKLNMSQQENNTLQSQIDKSVKTIQNLTQKIQAIKKSYKEMSDHAENIQNRVLQLYGKYNHQLINKSVYEENAYHMHQNIINKTQMENKLLKERIYQIEEKYQDMKMEFNKMETIIEGLKYDNLQIRKINYQYEVELQKVGFMKQKIGKLSSEVDRVAQQNIQLNQQVKQCRFAIGDQATLDKKLFQSYLMIVLLSAEVQALRARLPPGSRENSRMGSLEKQKIDETIYNERQKLTRVKSEQGPFRNIISVERRDASRSRSKSKNKIDDQFTFERLPQREASLGDYPKFPPLQIPGSKQEGSKRVSRLITYQFQDGVAVPRTSGKYIDRNLSNLLRKSPTRQKSRDKTPKKTTYY